MSKVYCDGCGKPFKHKSKIWVKRGMFLCDKCFDDEGRWWGYPILVMEEK